LTEQDQSVDETKTPVEPAEPTTETPEQVVETDKTEATEEVVEDQPLVDLQKKYDDLEDSYLRSQAEIKNMHARHQKEQASLLKYDGQALAKDVLPVLDNLERALATEATDDNGEQLKKGVQMTYDHMLNALKDHGVQEIEAAGKTFDPTIHQAVQTVAVEGDQKADTVVQVFQKGYYLKDRVLRPAMVVVAQ